MAKEKPQTETTSQVEPSVSEAGSLPLASYSLVGLEDQGDQIYIPIMARSYTRSELLFPAIAETLHMLGWPHIEKN